MNCKRKIIRIVSSVLLILFCIQTSFAFDNKNVKTNLLSNTIIGKTVIAGQTNNATENPNKHYAIDWCIIGDSISDHRRYKDGEKLYMDYITDETHLTCCNLAKMGAGFISAAYENKQWGAFSHYISALQIPKDTHVVIVFGSFNDTQTQFLLGKPTDNKYGTILGCATKFLINAKQTNPNIKIGLVIPMEWKMLEDEAVEKAKCEAYVQGLKEWANINNIPTLDLYRQAKYSGYDLSNINNFYEKDKIHVSLKVHKNFVAPKVKEFLLMLLNS